MSYQIGFGRSYTEKMTCDRPLFWALDRLEHRRYHQLINNIIMIAWLSMCWSCIKWGLLPHKPLQPECGKQSIAASNNCHQLLKAQGTLGSQFDNPTEVSVRVRSSWLPVVSLAERVLVANLFSLFFRVHCFFFGGSA